VTPADRSVAVPGIEGSAHGAAAAGFPVLDADLTLIPAGPRAALLQLAGVYRAEPGEDGHGTAATPLGGFLDQIAETIAQVDATAS